jgi:hypothetical protein
MTAITAVSIAKTLAEKLFDLDNMRIFLRTAAI